MSEARPAAIWTPLVAFGATAAGVLVLFFGNRLVAPLLFGGAGSTCAAPDCALGLGIWLIVGAFAALCLSFVAGIIVAVVRGSAPGVLRRGLVVAGCCALAYLIESAVLWVLF